MEAYTINAFIAVGSLSVLFITGSFQANSLRNENQRFMVEQQIREFEAKRDDLHQQVSRLRKERDRAVLEVNQRKAAQQAAESKLERLTIKNEMDPMKRLDEL